MSAIFSLVVLSAPSSSQGSLSAYHFAQAALAKHHRILQVFFYGNGAYHGFATGEIPQDEINLDACWQQLAREHGFHLMLCSGSAQRRGHDEHHPPLSPFQLTGLGTLAEAYAQSHRVLVFGHE
jgi:tRNA 2-thiouridine synthesizing protein D